jgi:ABC-type polysaccharide/polyol phosphate export permease/tetratricopeptide (TPR) repeat protein
LTTNELTLPPAESSARRHASGAVATAEDPDSIPAGEERNAPGPQEGAHRIGELRLEVAKFVTAGEWSAAAGAAVELADICIGEAEPQRLASGYLVQIGQPARAAAYARRAMDLDPSNAEYALHCGVVLNLVGDHMNAIRVLLKAADLDHAMAETYQQLAFASERLGNAKLAAQAALRAWRLEPRDDNRRLSAAHFLARTSRLDEAIDILRTVNRGAASSASVRRTLSGFLGQAGRHAEALDAIDGALAQEPDCAEYHLQRSWLLGQVGRWQEALAAVRRAIELDPRSRGARRHAVSVLVETGDLPGALRQAGELLAEAPDEEEYVSCMRYLLEARSTHAAALDFMDIAALKASAAPRAPSPPPRFSDALAAQGRSIGALVLRDIRSRYGESRLGFLWSLMEPFLHIGALAVVFQFTMHGRPPLGDNFFFFYFTGVLPYLLISHLILHIGHAVKDQRQLLQIPTVAPIDVVVGKFIVENFTTAVIFMIFLGLFAVFGVDPLPVSLPHVFLAFFLTSMLGFGLGMLCAALFELGAVIEHVVGLVVRLLYFASGIFYVPAAMPLRARDIIVYNPFLHIIDCMRVGFFRSYAPEWMDVGYAAKCALFALLVGTAAVTIMSRRMRSLA